MEEKQSPPLLLPLVSFRQNAQVIPLTTPFPSLPDQPHRERLTHPPPTPPSTPLLLTLPAVAPMRAGRTAVPTTTPSSPEKLPIRPHSIAVNDLMTTPAASPSSSMVLGGCNPAPPLSSSATYTRYSLMNALVPMLQRHQRVHQGLPRGYCRGTRRRRGVASSEDHGGGGRGGRGGRKLIYDDEWGPDRGGRT